ncbi:MAG: DUF4956 domain-containing protein [bacterium]
MNDYLQAIGQKVFQEMTTSSISVEAVVLVVVLTFGLGLLLSWVYQKTFSGTSYSSSFVVSLVVLAIITALVMLTIGSNLARAFGLVGALSIIRFRTAIKDPKDIMFLFLSLAVGMMVGTQNYHIAIVGTLLSLLAVYYLNRANYGLFTNSQYFLTIRVKKDSFDKSDLDSLLNAVAKEYSLNNFTTVYEDQNLLEVVYRVKLTGKGSEKKLLDALAAQGSYDRVSLVSTENYVEY